MTRPVLPAFRGPINCMFMLRKMGNTTLANTKLRNGFNDKKFTVPGLMLEGNSGKEVALWLLTSLCTSAKREVEVAL